MAGKRVFSVLALLGAIILMVILANGNVSALQKATEVSGGKYPNILIKNDNGDLISRYSLVNNSEHCAFRCEAVIKLDNYVAWSLPAQFDNTFNFNFYDLKQALSKRLLSFNVQVAATNKTEQVFTSYTCTPYNATENRCTANFKNVSVPNYNPINLNSNVPVGTIYIKLIGTKDPYDSIEWVPVIRNFAFNEWATWGSTELGANLSGYWAFNSTSGTTAYDSLGFWNGTLVNSPTWQPGISGNAVNLSGGTTNQYVNLSSGGFTQIINTLNKPTSISFWMNVTNFSGDTYMYVMNLNSDNATGQLIIYFPDINHFGFGFRGVTSFCRYDFPYANIRDRWVHVVAIHTGGTRSSNDSYELYINGTLYTAGKAMQSVGGSGLTNFIGIDSDKTTGDFNGRIDELAIYRRQISSTEVSDLYNGGASFPYTIPGSIPEVSLNYQKPSDINTHNLFTQLLNISYNLSIGAINSSSITLSFKVNNTQSDCFSFVNGSSVSCNYQNRSYSSNSTNLSYAWVIGDNFIYPASYNFDEFYMERATKLNYSLNNVNTFIAADLLNISSSKAYSFLEFYAENTTTGTNPLIVYYCNSTYSAGIVNSSSSCIQIASVLASTPYNHTHSNFSRHYVLPLGINTTTGSIGSVKVTPESKILLEGVSSGVWNAKYISNYSRSGAARTSINGGVSWSDLSGTMDLHIHQYIGNETLYYYASVQNTSGTWFTSGISSDLLDLSTLPPQAPVVISPSANVYSNTTIILINYTAAVPVSGFPIAFYNITLLNQADNLFNKTIITNNSLYLNYSWVTNGTLEGQYLIEVRATDTNGASSAGYSLPFSLDSTAPNITLLHPLNSTVVATTFYLAANITDGVALGNATLKIYNATAVVGTAYSALSGASQIFNASAQLTDGNYSWSVFACDYVGNCRNSTLGNFSVDLPPQQYNISMIVAQYPFVDFNVSYPIGINLSINGTTYTAANVFMNLSESNGTTFLFSLPYNAATGLYEVTLLFDTIEDYTFNIYETNPKLVGENVTGALYVREPFYLTVEVYKDKNSTQYINNFAYITAELSGGTKYGVYETYLTPLTYTTGVQHPLFHEQYINGDATLKLWEKDVNYSLRLVDGIISFPSSYSVPSVAKTYKTNIYLGEVFLNGTDSTYKFLVTSKDIHPYRWLWNALFIIGIVAIAVGAGALLMMFPTIPWLSLIFGIVFTTILIITRIAIWLIWGS